MSTSIEFRGGMVLHQLHHQHVCTRSAWVFQLLDSQRQPVHHWHLATRRSQKHAGLHFSGILQLLYNSSAHFPGSLCSCKVIAGSLKYGWIAIDIICVGCKDFLSMNYRCSMNMVNSECIQTESRSIVMIDIDDILPICVFKEIKTPVQCSTPVVIRVIMQLKPFPSSA